MLVMKLAREEHLNRVDELFIACIKNLNDNKIFQWDDSYPNRDTFIEAIKLNTLYVFFDKDKLIGAAILNELQADEWSRVSWKYTDSKPLVIHAFAVDIKTQGKGYGQKLLNRCQEFALEKGYLNLRLDAFSENPIAIKFYEKNKYEKVGSVIFPFKPKGHQKYICYEKRMC